MVAALSHKPYAVTLTLVVVTLAVVVMWVLAKEYGGRRAYRSNSVYCHEQHCKDASKYLSLSPHVFGGLLLDKSAINELVDPALCIGCCNLVVDAILLGEEF